MHWFSNQSSHLNIKRLHFVQPKIHTQIRNCELYWKVWRSGIKRKKYYNIRVCFKKKRSKPTQFDLIQYSPHRFMPHRSFDEQQTISASFANTTHTYTTIYNIYLPCLKNIITFMTAVQQLQRKIM